MRDIKRYVYSTRSLASTRKHSRCFIFITIVNAYIFFPPLSLTPLSTKTLLFLYIDLFLRHHIWIDQTFVNDAKLFWRSVLKIMNLRPLFFLFFLEFYSYNKFLISLKIKKKLRFLFVSIAHSVLEPQRTLLSRFHFLYRGDTPRRGHRSFRVAADKRHCFAYGGHQNSPSTVSSPAENKPKEEKKKDPRVFFPEPDSHLAVP